MAEVKYALFAGSVYYPSGGWNDFCGVYDTVEAALSVANPENYDWWHVVDMDTLIQVETGDNGLYNRRGS